MATLTEETTIEALDLLTETGTITARSVVVIKRDGVEVARVPSYLSFVPGDDPATAPAIVRKVALAVWTPEQIAASKARKLAEASRPPP